MTDATDQDLYFELDIKDLLAKHNAKRATFRNKAIKDRVENLEPVRVSGLKMSVTVIADFG